MEENYIEWLVKRKDPVYAWPVKILMIVVCALSVLAALQMLLGILILAAAAAATYFVFLNLSVEYEYLFADGGFSVDSILGKARRKKTFDCDKEDVQVIAPANSYVLKDYEKQGMKVIDCTSHNAGADVYALISQKGETSINEVAERSYIPALNTLIGMVKDSGGAFKVALSISGVALEQLEIHAPAVIDLLHQLNDTGCCEFLAEPYSHGLSSLANEDCFKEEVMRQSAKMKQMFGKAPKVFRNSSLIYNDEIGAMVASMGFKGMLTEEIGRAHV